MSASFHKKQQSNATSGIVLSPTPCLRGSSGAWPMMHHPHHLPNGAWTSSWCATCSGEGGVSKNRLHKGSLGFLESASGSGCPVSSWASVGSSTGQRWPLLLRESGSTKVLANVRCTTVAQEIRSVFVKPDTTTLLHHGACNEDRHAHLTHVESHAHVRVTSRRVETHGHVGPRCFTLLPSAW